MANDYEQEFPRVTRVEVIDYTKGQDARVFVKWQDGIKVSVSLQDDGRTMKIFISQPQKAKRK
jgi:hypothetical protein